MYKRLGFSNGQQWLFFIPKLFESCNLFFQSLTLSWWFMPSWPLGYSADYNKPPLGLFLEFTQILASVAWCSCVFSPESSWVKVGDASVPLSHILWYNLWTTSFVCYIVTNPAKDISIPIAINVSGFIMSVSRFYPNFMKWCIILGQPIWGTNFYYMSHHGN